MEKYMAEKKFSEADAKKSCDTDVAKSDDLWINGEYLDLEEYDNHKTIKYGCFQCAGEATGGDC
jgi:hypothetical protein